MTNVIIFSHAYRHRLLPPTVHLIRAFGLSPGHSWPLPFRPVKNSSPMKNRKGAFLWFSHRRLYAPCCFHDYFFLISAIYASFVPRSPYLSTWITPGLRDSDRIACMRCLNCASLNFGAQPHIIMCMQARKLFRASEPIKGLKKESHM